MEILFLGTGASEGIPALFCHCRICENARKKKEKEQRTRCQAVINGELLLDFGPDTYAHYLRYDFPLPDIRTLLVTHSHTDHFYATDLGMRREGLAHPDPGVLDIYGDQTVGEQFKREFLNNKRVLACNHFHEAVPFKAISNHKYEIIPLQANHDKSELCLFYSIQEKESGKAVLYAHDTGLFPKVTWDFLMRYPVEYNLVSLDCNSMLGRDGKNHMGLADDLEVLARLREIGRVTENTSIVLNHFSHNSQVTHAEMVKAVQAMGFIVAYDGLCCKM